MERIEPSIELRREPCSFVAVSCAWRDACQEPFRMWHAAGVREDGYLSLNDMNRYLRGIFNQEGAKIVKKTAFKRGERPKLESFLAGNKDRYIVCVLGHYVYANGEKYWSFFDNDNDDVVCVWKIE